MEIVFDIETAREYKEFNQAPLEVQNCWKKLSLRKYPKMKFENSYKEWASLYPEFARIVCISAKKKGERITTFSSAEEELILTRFFTYIGAGVGSLTLIGHGIINFDIAFVRVRCAKNRVGLHKIFRTYQYENAYVGFVDTRDVWRGNNYHSPQASSLEAICMVLGVESPKQGLQGHEVPDYYHSGDPEALYHICRYCERDVIAIESVYNILKELKIL